MIALPPRIIAKPAFGAPCNGCGFCCAMSPCGIALDLLPEAREGEPCPALELTDGRSACGLIVRPAHYLGLPVEAVRALGPQIAEALGVGRGCDAAILEEEG